jgi:hypothetical protein
MSNAHDGDLIYDCTAAEIKAICAAFKAQGKVPVLRTQPDGLIAVENTLTAGERDSDWFQALLKAIACQPVPR